MGKFSAELAGIMDTRDLPIEEVTRGAGVSRSAFFKYKNGSRLPADIQTVRRLAEVLHLNHDEGERLEEAYIIDQLGEYRYRGMMAIEKLLTTPVGSLRVRRPEAELPDLVQGNEPQKLLSGNLTVSVHLLAAISEGVRQGEVTVFGTVSGEEIFRIIGRASLRCG